MFLALILFNGKLRYFGKIFSSLIVVFFSIWRGIFIDGIVVDFVVSVHLFILCRPFLLCLVEGIFNGMVIDLRIVPALSLCYLICTWEKIFANL